MGSGQYEYRCCVVFCCCDKNNMTNAIREERVYLCYGSREMSVSWWGGMVAGAEAVISYLEPQVQIRKSRLEMG